LLFSGNSPIKDTNRSANLVLNICAYLELHDILQLSSTSKAWYYSLSEAFLAVLTSQWLVPLKTRQILSDLVGAFAGAHQRPIYNWKQLHRYLEGISQEVDPSTALHEQLLTISAVAHFLMTEDPAEEAYRSFLAESIKWISQASKSIADRWTFGPTGDGKGVIFDIRDAPNVAIILDRIGALAKSHLESFVRDLAKTHLQPVLRDYADAKESEDEALEVLLCVAEIWRKLRDLASVLASWLEPFERFLVLNESTSKPIMRSCIDIKSTLLDAMETELLVEKSTVLTCAFKIPDSVLRSHSSLLHHLAPFFSVIKEPAAATFFPRPSHLMAETRKKPKNALVKTVDGFRIKTPIKHIERWSKLQMDLEKALKAGSHWNIDDTLDEAIDFPELLLIEDYHRLRSFSEILDESEGVDDDSRREACKSFARSKLVDPRTFAAFLLSGREVGLELLVTALQDTLSEANAQHASLQVQPNDESDGSSEAEGEPSRDPLPPHGEPDEYETEG
jgi:hypothetical protein